MNLVKAIMTNNPCYKAGKKITVKGLMLHSVGCPQPSAKVFINNWDKSTFDRACVHGFIDANDGTIYQTLPWNHRGWHGGGSSNNTHIGVEMCEPSCIRYTSGAAFTCSDKEKAKAAATRTYNAAVELFAFLCEEYNLNPLTDICSHKEGYKKGIASNHGDPEHLWNGLGLPYTMDTFRNAVKAKMKSTSAPATPSTGSATTKPTTQSKFPTVPFLAYVNVPDLNYRSKPSMEGEVKGQTGKGTFTITEVVGEWGKLKSGVGYIYLGNPEYVSIGKSVAPAKPAFEPYLVKIATDALNIRKGPSTLYKVNRCLRDEGGVYTIVAQENNWGKLKSGEGWICLDYTKKL